MTESTPKLRWYLLTPDRVVLLLLAVECLLWLSNWLGWPAWHKGYAVLTCLAAVGGAMILLLVWFGAALVFRWRFQFKIRSLLLMAVVVAIPCSWVKAEFRAAKTQQEAAEEIERAYGTAYYDYQFDSSGDSIWIPAPPTSPGPPWLCKLLGEHLFANVVRVDFCHGELGYAGLERFKLVPFFGSGRLQHTAVSDTVLEHLKRLPRLQVLNLGDTNISDTRLEFVAGLPQLQSLGLSDTTVSGAGLQRLKGLSRLEVLDLAGTKVNDAGLEHIKELTQIQQLYLSDTHISDAGLQHLRGLPEIRDLNLENNLI